MKTARKVMLLVLCAALLVSATVMGTLAYLTSTDEVTNTFTVGSVAITLDEAPVDKDGKAIEGDRVQKNEYHLIPGSTYDKDPTVHVAASSESVWLFVEVANGIAAIEADTTDTTIAAQMAANDWSQIEGTNVYAYKDIVAGGDNVVVFETFTIAGDAETAEDTVDEITVTAYAVQSENFDTAAKAWAATFGDTAE